MRKCPFCKQEIPEIAKKCPSCSRVLIEEIDSIPIDATKEAPIRETPTPIKKNIPKRKWYYRGWFITLMLFLFPPIGIILMWTGSVFGRGLRIGLTIIFGLAWFRNLPEFYKPPLETMYEDMYNRRRQEIFLPQMEIKAMESLYVSKKQHRAELPVSQIAKSQKSVVLIKTRDKSGKDITQGSGFIICKSGFIVTNYHVLERAYSAIIKFIDGSTYDNVSLVAKDPRRDLAIIKIAHRNPFPFVYLGNSDEVKIGDRIVAIGNPLGYEGTISDGLISAIREREGTKYFQITAPISLGSSGGPLFSTYGEVVGITTAFAPFGQNLNFAIPINYVKLVIEEKKKNYTLISPTPKVTSRLSREEIEEILKRSYNSLPNGTVIGGSYSKEGLGQLKVDNGSDLDGVIKLVDLAESRLTHYIYIKSHNQYTIRNICDGKYKLLFALGKDWDEKNRRFLQFRVFLKFYDNFDFITRETVSYDQTLTEYSIFEVTLHPIVGGTAKTDNISKAEFDMY